VGSAISDGELSFSGNVVVTASLAGGASLPVLDGRQITLADFRAVLAGSSDSLRSVALEGGPTTFGATFGYLLPGFYTVSIEAPTGVSFTASPAFPTAIEVSQGQDTNIDFVIAAASVP
jgi:hypothetical protein